MSFNLSRPYSIFSFTLLYNEEAVSRTIRSLSACVSRVATTGVETALYKFVTMFYIQLVSCLL